MSTEKKGFEGINRSSRETASREKQGRRKPWTPPSMLDAPPAPEGYKHRWIRAEVRGFDDTKNISARLREGYELVRLARIPVETVEERADYFSQRNADQIEAVESDMMRENAHPTMAISKPERQSRVTFGGPKK